MNLPTQEDEKNLLQEMYEKLNIKENQLKQIKDADQTLLNGSKEIYDLKKELYDTDTILAPFPVPPKLKDLFVEYENAVVSAAEYEVKLAETRLDEDHKELIMIHLERGYYKLFYELMNIPMTVPKLN